MRGNGQPGRGIDSATTDLPAGVGAVEPDARVAYDGVPQPPTFEPVPPQAGYEAAAGRPAHSSVAEVVGYEAASQQAEYAPDAQQAEYAPGAQQVQYAPGAQEAPEYAAGTQQAGYAPGVQQDYEASAQHIRYDAAVPHAGFDQASQHAGYDPAAPHAGFDHASQHAGYEPAAPHTPFEPGAQQVPYGSAGYHVPTTDVPATGVPAMGIPSARQQASALPGPFPPAAVPYDPAGGYGRAFGSPYGLEPGVAGHVQPDPEIGPVAPAESAGAAAEPPARGGAVVAACLAFLVVALGAPALILVWRSAVGPSTSPSGVVGGLLAVIGLSVLAAGVFPLLTNRPAPAGDPPAGDLPAGDLPAGDPAEGPAGFRSAVLRPPFVLTAVGALILVGAAIAV
jgi:hypothetical protein